MNCYSNSHIHDHFGWNSVHDVPQYAAEHELRENRCSERHFSEGRKWNFDLYCTFGTEDVNENASGGCKFCGSWHDGRETLLTGMSEFIGTWTVYICLKICIKFGLRDLQAVLLRDIGVRKPRFSCKLKWHFVYAGTEKQWHFEVKNALV